MDKTKKAKFKKSKEEGRPKKALLQKTGEREYIKQKKTFGRVFDPREIDDFEDWED